MSAKTAEEDDKESSSSSSSSSAPAIAEGKEGDRNDDAAALQARRTLHAVRDYLFNDMALEREVQAFCAARVGDVAAEGGEQRLCYTTHHEAFAALFEARIEEAVRSAGECSLDAFMRFLARIAAAAAADEQGGQTAGAKQPGVDEDDKAFLETLLAVVDYDCFMILMRETKRGNRWTLDGMFAR